MQLYRFSPIKNKEELMQAIRYIHFACHELCMASFGRYLPTAGNIGVFCHYDDEYREMTALREKLTDPAAPNYNQKYFKLHEPITIEATGDVTGATYDYLYIRWADPYRHHVGDLDFFLPKVEFAELKKKIKEEKGPIGVRISPSTSNDLVELYRPDIDALAYVGDEMMEDAVNSEFKNFNI